MKTMIIAARVLGAVVPLFWPAWSSAADATVAHDTAAKTVSMVDAAGNLSIRLNYDNRCILDQVQVHGIDVLNPVQPECMDVAKVLETYAGRLSFSGTLGTQTTLPFGTAEDVMGTTRRNLQLAGPNGGLLCCPTHMLEPEVPWANIEAYAEGCRQWRG